MLIFEPLTTARWKGGAALGRRWAPVRKLTNEQACRLSYPPNEVGNISGSSFIVHTPQGTKLSIYCGMGGRCSIPRLRAA